MIMYSHRYQWMTSSLSSLSSSSMLVYSPNNSISSNCSFVARRLPFTMAEEYNCASQHLCGMGNPASTFQNPSHKCCNCRRPVCGSLCAELLAEEAVSLNIPYDSLTDTGQDYFNCHTALICRICIGKCSTALGKESSSENVSNHWIIICCACHSCLWYKYFILYSPLLYC